MPSPLDALRERIALRIGKLTYVVVVKDDSGGFNLIVDLGLNQPWHSKNKKHADIVASECDGAVFTFEDAFKLLLKQEGSADALERALVERMRNVPKSSARFVKNAKTGEILDAHGRPLPNAGKN